MSIIKSISMTFKYHKRLLFLVVILLLIVNTGCNNKANEVIQGDKDESHLINKEIGSDEFSNDEGTISTRVMLKSIEAIEDEGSLKIIITSFEDTITKFMKDFEVKYYDDYYELRFTNLNTNLSEELLIHPRNLTDIAGSNFIKAWYETQTNIDHSTAYSILFRAPIKYTVQELTNPGRIVISIEKNLEKSDNLYLLRSPSCSLSETWSHIYATASLTDYLDFTLHFRILRDEAGYFYPIKAFNSKKEAETFKNDMLELYEEKISDSSGYSANYSNPYSLIIVKQNELKNN